MSEINNKPTHCMYCKNCYIQFCTLKCRKHKEKRNLDSNVCKDYSYTDQPIERRSLN